MKYGYILKLDPNEKGVLTAALNDYLEEIKPFKLDKVLDGLIETTENVLKQLKNLEPSLFIEEEE